MPHSNRPGDVLAGRYRLVDLLSESGNGRFWRAHDQVLERHVALHVIAETDERAAGLVEAARRSATVLDQRFLRVLDAERSDGLCYVVNEWGSGTSLDIIVATHGPLPPRRAAWLVAEVADSIAVAHAADIAHGRLAPENVLVDHTGAVKVIGFCVDAALHGLPPGRPTTDLADLAGLLHCALTGRWAGVSASAVPLAPQEHGRVLRPRQVRAGVPRPLDALCDEVLNPYSTLRNRDGFDLETARGIADLLADFVGDPTGLPEQLALANVRPGETVVLPQVPEIAPHDAEPEPEPEPARAVPEPEPTQAGLPIFDDVTDDVSWLNAPETPAPPPPPFEEPPERPLFAPEPADGGPVRQSRPSAIAVAGPEGRDYWPWEGTDPGRATGAGLTPVDEEVPGRSWLRLAMGIGAAVLLLIAVVIAFNLGRGKTPLGSDPDPDPSPSTSGSPSPSDDPSPTAIDGVTATEFNPEGDESGAPVVEVVDGDPATTWRTAGYFDQLAPDGYRSGVGLLLDLGSPQPVAEVDLTMVGEPTDVSLYVTDDAPDAVTGLDPVTTATVGTSDTLTLDAPVTGRYAVVWLTSLPAVGGDFRGEVAEVEVRG